VRLDTILDRLDAFGLPYAFLEFKDSELNPAPGPPFIVYLTTIAPRGPDEGPALIEQVDVAIELYTDEPAPALENRLEAEILEGVDYRRFQAVIDSENMVQTAYEFTITQKRRLTP